MQFIDHHSNTHTENTRQTRMATKNSLRQRRHLYTISPKYLCIYPILLHIQYCNCLFRGAIVGRVCAAFIPTTTKLLSLAFSLSHSLCVCVVLALHIEPTKFTYAVDEIFRSRRQQIGPPKIESKEMISRLYSIIAPSSNIKSAN